MVKFPHYVSSFLSFQECIITYDKESVHMNSGVRCRLHLLEYCKGWFVVRPEFKDMAEVESSFLEMAIGF